MEHIEQNLANWRASHMVSIPVAGLLSRNPTAYKWKALFRCWVLREATFWRVTDLLTQSISLHRQGHGLGSRILLRSGFETLAALIYLNHNIQGVLDGKLEFHSFCELTNRQLGGSKNISERPEAINVITMMQKGDKQYPGLRGMYDSLSESAHPNFEGLVWGYSKVDHEEYETKFSNRWLELYGNEHNKSVELCMEIFEHEYDLVWAELIEKLESYVVANDAKLEATRKFIS